VALTTPRVPAFSQVSGLLTTLTAAHLAFIMSIPVAGGHSRPDDEKGSGERSIPASELVSGSIGSNDAEKHDPEYGSYSDHVFADEQVAEYWRGVYEKAHYEGRHQLDPQLTWSADEEKRLRRKVCRPTCCIFSLLNILRLTFESSHGPGPCSWHWTLTEGTLTEVSLSSVALRAHGTYSRSFTAITDKMLPELGMNTNDFNTGQTIFLLSFLAAELPSGLISKKLGPDM
jgi:hypothetical protein